MTPITRITNGVASMNTRAISTTAAMTAIRPAYSVTYSGAAPGADSKVISTVARVPGPAISGNASGNTEMSARCLASAFSSGVVFSSRSNTMLSAMMNSMMPPPIRNAEMLIPIMPMNALPIRAKTTRIASAIALDLIAMRRR